MAIDGPGMAAVLATYRRLRMIREPLLEALEDPQAGVLGNEVLGAWMGLRDAFVDLEAKIRAVVPQGDPVWPPGGF